MEKVFRVLYESDLREVNEFLEENNATVKMIHAASPAGDSIRDAQAFIVVEY